MSKLEFTNSNSIIKETPVILSVTYSGESIDTILYGYTGFNYNLKCYDRLGLDYILRSENITYAGNILLLSEPTWFYKLFTLLKNESNKEALKEALKKVNQEYEMFYNESISGTTEFNPFFTSYDLPIPLINTSLSFLYKMYCRIELDESCKLKGIVFKNGGKTPMTYDRQTTKPHFDNYVYPTWYYSVLTPEIAEKFARAICQSAKEEYQKLLEIINPNDEYYSYIVRGGSTYASDIKRLVRKCN